MAFGRTDLRRQHRGNRAPRLDIKDVGTQGPNRLLVSFNSTSPFVGSGQAILISAPPFGGEIHGEVFNDLNQDGMNDAGDPALAGWN